MLIPMNEDLNIISKLGDCPNLDDGLSPEALKAKFDEAGNKIKDYLNNEVVIQVGLITPLVVAVYGDADNGYGSAPGFDTIQAAHNAGRPVVAKHGNRQLDLMEILPTLARFGCVDTGITYVVEITTTGVAVQTWEGASLDDVNVLSRTITAQGQELQDQAGLIDGHTTILNQLRDADKSIQAKLDTHGSDISKLDNKYGIKLNAQQNALDGHKDRLDGHKDRLDQLEQEGAEHTKDITALQNKDDELVNLLQDVDERLTDRLDQLEVAGGGDGGGAVNELSQVVTAQGEQLQDHASRLDQLEAGGVSAGAYLDITQEGVVSLKQAYRGVGTAGYPASVGDGQCLPLPEVLVIPEMLGGKPVTALADGMFYANESLREVTLPDGVSEIPIDCFRSASNLRAIHNTDHITKIGTRGFGATRLKTARFPNLTELGTFAFAACGYLETVDIGKIQSIPQNAFANCAFLREVSGGDNVTSIDTAAFYYTRRLRDLPLLSHVAAIGKRAFFGSRICTAMPTGGEIHEQAFPTSDNHRDFWSGVKYTPCQNRVTTKLSQMNSAWKTETIVTDAEGKNYRYGDYGCALLSVLHIHSAISGKYYDDPRSFMAELKADPELSKFTQYENWPGLFNNVAPMLQALGYTTKVYGTASAEDDLTQEDYKALLKALSAGAYVYAQVGLATDWEEGYFDAGHAVMLYGVNDLGEVHVLDSSVLHESFRATGFEPDRDIYTYTMAYQNLVGPSSNFVVVYPPEVDPEGDEPYILPQAAPDTLGGVQPAAKTEGMTNPVGVDELGRLWSSGDNGEYIPAPAAAAVGQTIVVKEVDDEGKPTQWEMADLSSGGDGWRLAKTVEIAEGNTTTKEVLFTEDDDGAPLNCLECCIEVYNPSPTKTSDAYIRVGDGTTTIGPLLIGRLGTNGADRTCLWFVRRLANTIYIDHNANNVPNYLSTDINRTSKLWELGNIASVRISSDGSYAIGEKAIFKLYVRGDG